MEDKLSDTITAPMEDKLSDTIVQPPITSQANNLHSRQDPNLTPTAPMEDKLSDTIVQPPILRLPTEIRLKIYRHLLVSDTCTRMQSMQMHNDEGIQGTRTPHCIYPAILRTCHLIHAEATDVLYRENVFLAHRIVDSNSNAPLIRRVMFIIGSMNIKVGGREVSGLSNFLDTHPNVKSLAIGFR
ncbi:hypothetical protein MMC31_002157 [Peltigera leucophlebia]|nr:hypothetical protein [Peltigera leucophlebia]